MATPYSRIYENVLPKFKNYDIPVMGIHDVKDMLHDFMLPAITKFHACRNDLSDRDDENECFNCDLTDDEIEILGNYMLIGYTDSEYIQTPTLLKVNLSSSDFNAFSPANFLDKLMSMHDYYIHENDTWLARYAWKDAHERGVRFGSGYNKSGLLSGKGYRKHGGHGQCMEDGD